MAGLRAAEYLGRKSELPRVSFKVDLLTQNLMSDPNVSSERIEDMFHVSTATLYRYVSPEGERRM